MIDVLPVSTRSGNSRLESNCSGKKRISVCAGCRDEILDQYILRVSPDLEWHATCLRCVECGQMLDENCTCFVRQEKTYCRTDYIRLFGAKCASCRQFFSEHDLVMRARSSIYHVDCFRCVACNRRLIQGDEFCLRDAGLLCRADHDVAEATTNDEVSFGNDNDSNDTQFNAFNNNNNNDTKTCDVSPASDSTTRSVKVTGRTPGSRSHKSSSDHHKTTRVRTVLNEKQLHTLRTCYGANPRPDALMKEQLVEMTGLSPRVIRVWFQNKRCKDKKRSILLKQIQQQQQQQQEKGEICDSNDLWICQKGVPMVASSPVRHDPSVSAQIAPIEVHQYSLPWKALAEFGELEIIGRARGHLPPAPPPTPSAPPAFQQLINSFGELSGDDDDETVVCFKESKVNRLRKTTGNNGSSNNNINSGAHSDNGVTTAFAHLIMQQQIAQM